MSPLCDASDKITCDVQEIQTVAVVVDGGKTYKYRIEPINTEQKARKSFRFTLECAYNFSKLYHGPIDWQRGSTCEKKKLSLDQFALVVKENGKDTLVKELGPVDKDNPYFEVDVDLEWDEGLPYPFTFQIKELGTDMVDTLNLDHERQQHRMQIDQPVPGHITVTEE
jgi:hypothetical protein